MIATAAGPYEHTGAYQESELFDTSDVPDGFCPHCEHAPCISGIAPEWCALSPRYIAVRHLDRDIVAQYVKLPSPDSRINAAFIAAFSRLGSMATDGSYTGDRALLALERVLLALRAEDES
jgi:hypothetical protein